MMHADDEPVTTGRCDSILCSIAEHAELERGHRAEQE